ncbi:MAG: YhbY family RNA-binding protein [Clostridiales bacterium]|nr:YhbY family RNA-binding protein [Clostridiales bacterium]
MTGKERAAFRKEAATLKAIIQIGKENVTPNLIQTVDAALKKRGLIKLSVLESSELSAGEAAEQLAAATGADIIQCIGRKLVLYRAPEEDPK